MEPRILTLHPQGKKGVNIDLNKYEVIKDFILDYLEKNGPTTYSDLNDLAVDQLQPSFDGKVVWYLVTVKLDLEARRMIERVPKTSPHQVRLKTS
jgi:hypothetical protein